jgi:lipopolysaccharide transport system ATP-binding protein
MTAPIHLDSIAKCYRIFHTPQDRFKQALRDRFLPARYNTSSTPLYREHWALRNVSFELQPGEAVGVVGRNGAGKSTLLQIIAGTLEPTSGIVTTRGRVMALLELGSGFNPEFTGLENVRLNAQILGLSQSEIEHKIDDIASFADIGDFIYQPVKIYSTGMMMRLAFSVQTVLDPDVLIVDEALSVGDARFQEKCFRKLQTLRDDGTTILLVSHDVNAVTSFCDRALLLESGGLVAQGPSAEVSRTYLRLIYGNEPNADPKNSPAVRQVAASETSQELNAPRNPSAGEDASRFGNGAVSIIKVAIHEKSGEPTRVLKSGMKYRISQQVLIRSAMEGLSSGFIVRNQRGVDLFGITNETVGMHVGKLEPGDMVTLDIDIEAWLAAGDYFLQAANASADGTQYDCHLDAVHFTVIGTPHLFTTSIVNLNPKVILTVSPAEKT